MSGEQMTLRGTLKGHSGWVTAIATTETDPNTVVTSSRDKTLMVWNITRGADAEDAHDVAYGVPKRTLEGHSHFVEDVCISWDGKFALSGSWDSTLRLWDIASGECTRRFADEGHTKDVLSVAFSADNRQIVSGSRDKTIKLWNTLAHCKYTSQDEGHTEWVSCVRFSPPQQYNASAKPLIVSAVWDKVVKVWSLSTCKLRTNLVGHKGYLNTVAVSPDGSLCASGGQDKVAMLWDLSEGKRLYSLKADDVIHELCFSPTRYWLCAATTSGIRIWDLESKQVVDELKPDWEGNYEGRRAQKPHCISMAWDGSGTTLYAGYTDNVVRVYTVNLA